MILVSFMYTQMEFSGMCGASQVDWSVSKV